MELGYLRHMETSEEFRQRVQREKQLAARLRLATTQLKEAEQERVWAIAAAKEAGLSIRQVAAAADLSPSRIHQLLNAQEASEIPVWLNQLRSPELLGSEQSTEHSPSKSILCAHLTAEVEVLRWCIDWLERLERGEDVVVNLRPEEDVKTEFVHFDRLRVLRVLSRITADLDKLAQDSTEVRSNVAVDGENPRAKHRHRLAEPEPKPQRRSQREEREALREALGLPPYSRY